MARYALLAATLFATACSSAPEAISSSDSAIESVRWAHIEGTRSDGGAGGLALRSGPSTNDDVLRVIPEGAPVRVIGDAQGEFAAVEYQGTNGWAHAEYLDYGDRGGILLEPPIIAQNPELPRGCEVTSLAMLLAYSGAPTNKMTLAAEVEKVGYWVGGVHGNPNDAFVGDMYSFGNAGYGVYHAPIARLAERHVPGRVQDISGSSFETLLSNLDAKRPVWVIANALFHSLAGSDFETWQTRSGNIQITWQEHSVLVTGYDSHSIFINDPLDPDVRNKPLDREAFRGAWEQMGRQAIVVR